MSQAQVKVREPVKVQVIYTYDDRKQEVEDLILDHAWNETQVFDGVDMDAGEDPYLPIR
jgi:hypothetical protein